MLKRILIVITVIIAICTYCYLHGKLWELMSPEAFPDPYYPIWFYAIVGIPFGIMFGILYICLAAILWPVIGEIINYIAGKEIFHFLDWDPYEDDDQM